MRVTKVFTPLFAAALGIAACTAAPAATLTPVPPTEAPATSPPTEAPIEAPTEAPAEQPTGAPTEAPAEGGLSGVRTYGFDSAASTASYTVDETFLSDNTLATAIGRTSTISGQLEINFDDPAASDLGTIEVDISLLESDSPRRDNAIRGQWLESTRFPLATFTATAIDGLTATPAEGEQVAFTLTGDMTVREATRPITWDVVAAVSGEAITGTATTTILMADFGVEPPNIAGIVSVKDGVLLTVEFTLIPVV
jgi:polyisoprenoid-binding protein YceI